MKLIFKVAKTELRNLFFSPVAWFLTIVFLATCAMFYANPITSFANQQDSMLKTMPSFDGFQLSLTRSIFTNMQGGLMSNIFSNLYLFIPLLTMALINREFNSGTYKLLYSSPLRVTQLVWGKFLAIMVYNLLLMTIVLMFIVVGCFSIKDLDLGHLACCLLAFYLVICTYTSIGMFMSSLTNYSIVAAVATFILLAVLGMIGMLWQEKDFFRDITYFLSIANRAETMVRGLITSRDVMYYVLITTMFLGFTYLSLKHGRESVPGWKKAVRYLGLFVVIITAGYLTSRPGYVLYLDGTWNKGNTIAPVTQDILANMKDEPLEVTLYTNLLGPGFERGRPSGRNKYIWDLWQSYFRFKPDINFKYVYYYDVKDGDSSLYKSMPNMSLDSIAKTYAKMMRIDYKRFIKPAEIRSKIDLQPENLRTVMHLKYKDKSIFLRTFDDALFWPNEALFAAAFKRLSNDTIPKVYASVGHYERSMSKLGEREFSTYSVEKRSRLSLLNNGFVFDTLDLKVQDIPADATAFVLADPKVELSAAEQARIAKYVSEGGNMLVYGEINKQHVLNPVLKQVGVTLMPGTLVQLSKNETPEKILPFISMDYTWLVRPETKRMKRIRELFRKGDTVVALFPGAVPVSFVDSGFKVSRLMVSQYGKSWVKAGELITDSVPPVMQPSEGDYKQDSFNLAIALERTVGNKKQRIAIAGDADHNSNMRVPTHYISTEMMAWMNHEAYPIDMPTTELRDNLMKISLPAAKAQKLFFVWILPGALLALGTIILVRRKRK